MIFRGGVHSTNLKKMGKIIQINAFSISRFACSLPFFYVFSDFAIFGGLGGLQPKFFLAGYLEISSEMTLAKKL